MKEKDLDNYIEEGLKEMSDRQLQEEIYKTLVGQGRNARNREKMLQWTMFGVLLSLGILLYNFPPPWLR